MSKVGSRRSQRRLRGLDPDEWCIVGNVLGEGGGAIIDFLTSVLQQHGGGLIRVIRQADMAGCKMVMCTVDRSEPYIDLSTLALGAGVQSSHS